MSDLVFNYEPHSLQLPFHNDRYKILYRAIIGGAGSGKTLAGSFEALSWAYYLKKSIGGVFEPNFRMLKAVTIPALEKILGCSLDLSPFIKRFNRSEMSLDVYNGSKIWMVGLDKPEAAEGMNLDWGWIDEPRLIPKLKPARESIIRRLRGSGLAEPYDKYVPNKAVGLWLTTTPDHPGSDLHGFLEDPKTRDPNSKVYRIPVTANPYLTKEFIASLKRAHTGALYDRFIDGKFAMAGVGSFDFDYSIHVIDSVDLNKIVNIVYGVDFGWTNPFVCLVIGFDGDGRAYILDEFYQRRLSDENMIAQLNSFQKTYSIGPFICDRSEPKTIKKLRDYNDPEDSNLLIDAKPSKAKRDESLRDIGSRFKIAGDGKPRLYILRKCVEFISEVQTYIIEKKENDHGIDALRYALSFRVNPKNIEIMFGKSRRRSLYA